MYTVTIESHDRVVTAGRVNAGKESINELSKDQLANVMAGNTVFLPSRSGPTAVVEMILGLETWEHRGVADSLPVLVAMESDTERQVALIRWAGSSKLLSH